MLDCLYRSAFAPIHWKDFFSCFDDFKVDRFDLGRLYTTENEDTFVVDIQTKLSDYDRENLIVKIVGDRLHIEIGDENSHYLYVVGIPKGVEIDLDYKITDTDSGGTEFVFPKKTSKRNTCCGKCHGGGNQCHKNTINEVESDIESNAKRIYDILSPKNAQMRNESEGSIHTRSCE